VGSTLLALDAGLNLERNYIGNQYWAFRFGTAKPECILCFASVQVKENRKFLLERKWKLELRWQEVKLKYLHPETIPTRDLFHSDRRGSVACCLVLRAARQCCLA
jgi:hypothetical protein